MTEVKKGGWQRWLDRLELKTLRAVLRDYPAAAWEFAGNAARGLGTMVSAVVALLLILFSPAVWLFFLVVGSIRQGYLAIALAFALWAQRHPRLFKALVWVNRTLCVFAWLYLAAFACYLARAAYTGSVTPSEAAKVAFFFALIAYLGVNLYRHK